MTAPLPHLEQTPARIIDRSFLQDVVAGLRAPQKHLSAKYFYDRRGSDLFEQITRLPEYYPTRTELAILDQLRPRDRRRAPAGRGPGRVRQRLHRQGAPPAAAPHRSRTYVPIDVSEEFLRSEAEELGRDFPRLRVEPVAADFTKPVTLPDDLRDAPKVGFFPARRSAISSPRSPPRSSAASPGRWGPGRR